MRIGLTAVVLDVAFLHAAGAVVLAPAASGPTDLGRPNPEVITGQLVVGFKQGVTASKQASILGAVGATTRLKLTRIRARVVTLPAQKTKTAMLQLRRNDNVKYAEPNFVVKASDITAGTPNDPSFDQLWGLFNHGQTINGATGVTGDDSNVRPAWAEASGKGIVVAVIDTGVDFSHPDLGGSAVSSPLLWINPGEDCAGCRTNGIDDDHDGYVDDWRGWDFRNNDNDPTDDNGHGTHVTGTIAAIADNGVGVVGVAPGVKIMPLKFLSSSGFGSTASAAEAIVYAADHGARVLSNSWGGHFFSQVVSDAVTTLSGAVGQTDARGALFVAAAGNDGYVDNNWMGIVTYPAALEIPNVVSVAAYDSSNHMPIWSNFGEHLVDLAAPGVDVLSTWPEGGYKYLSGTSMATPHVSGVTALLMERYPTMSASQIKALLLNDVHVLPPTPYSTTGYSWSETTKSHGALDAGYAITCRGPALKLWIDQPAKDFHAIVTKPVPITVIGESCPQGASYALTATMNGIPFALTDRGDGVYTGTFTPVAAGAVTIVATESAGIASQKKTVVGRADWQYTVSDDSYRWLDVTRFGKDTGLRSGWAFSTIPLPFPFTFYGQTFDAVTISGKGWITFGLPVGAPAPTNVYPEPIFPYGFPELWPPDGIIAPFWDAISLEHGGAIWAGKLGTAPHRRFVIAWTGRTPRGGGVSLGVPLSSAVCPGQGNFELVLEESTNLIRFEYEHVSFGCYPYGGNAVIGVENFTGDVATQFSRFGIGVDPAYPVGGAPVLKPYEQKKGLLFKPQLPGS